MKRFTDTEIWTNKPWFISLSPGEKCAWFYLTATCDNVGVCNPVRHIVDQLIGDKIDWDGLIAKTNNNIVPMGSGDWWLQKFCYFQHSDLGASLRGEKKPNNATTSYIELLKNHGLWQDYLRGLRGAGEDPKEKERVKVQEKEKERSDFPEMLKAIIKKGNGKK